MKTKKHGGRPRRIDGARKHSLYLGLADLKALAALARAWDCSRGEAARRAIRATAPAKI